MGVAAANESEPLNRSVRSRRQSKAISDDETDAEFVPQLDRLEYDLDDFGASHNHTIGSLGGKAPMKRRKISKEILMMTLLAKNVSIRRQDSTN